MKTIPVERVLFWVIAAFVAFTVACGSSDGELDATPLADGGGDAADVTLAAPRLVSTVPADSAVDVDVNGSIELEFSKPMNAGSVTITSAPGVALGPAQWDAMGTLATVPMTTALAFATSYKVTVNGQDREGLSMSESSFTFKTKNSDVDVTPPTLSSSNPIDGASSIATSAKLSIVFSEPMDVATVDVTVDPSVDLGSPSWNEGNTQIDFAAPLETFAANTDYLVTVVGKDVAGNALGGKTTIAFKTAPVPDTTAPTVKSTAPANAALGVSPNASVSLTFSEPMNVGTVTAATLSVVKSGGAAVPGVVSWDPSETLVTFDPSSNLAFSTSYTVTLTIGAKDKAGNPLAANYTFSFTTASAPDTTAPTVTFSNPKDGATGADRRPTISVTFSEPMDKASTRAAFSVTSPTGVTEGGASWNASGTTMTVPLTTTLPYGTQVTWRVETGAKDLAGNALAQAVSRTFRVRRLATRNIFPSFDAYMTDGGNPSTTGSQIQVGDTSSDNAIRGFLSFDLSVVPDDVLWVTKASFTVHQASATPSVYSDLGSLYLESVYFGSSLTSSDFDIVTLQYADCATGPVCVMKDLRKTLATSSTSTMTVDQVEKVRNDLANRASRGWVSQFRIRFNKKADDEGDFDRAYLYSSEHGEQGNRPQLTIEYEYP